MAQKTRLKSSARELVEESSRPMVTIVNICYSSLLIIFSPNDFRLSDVMYTRGGGSSKIIFDGEGVGQSDVVRRVAAGVDGGEISSKEINANVDSLMRE